MSGLEEQKKIEIVSGTGEDLNISPVYDHVNVNKSQEKPKNIIIPKSHSEKKEEEKEDDEVSSDKNNDKDNE